MLYTFPRTRFVRVNTLAIQLKHVTSELLEAREAYDQWDFDHLARELHDVRQSAETALRLLEERYGIDVAEAKRQVIQGNKARGYYEAHPMSSLWWWLRRQGKRLQGSTKRHALYLVRLVVRLFRGADAV